jgi:hypothetical protein
MIRAHLRHRSPFMPLAELPNDCCKLALLQLPDPMRQHSCHFTCLDTPSDAHIQVTQTLCQEHKPSACSRAQPSTLRHVMPVSPLVCHRFAFRSAKIGRHPIFNFPLCTDAVSHMQITGQRNIQSQVRQHCHARCGTTGGAVGGHARHSRCPRLHRRLNTICQPACSTLISSTASLLVFSFHVTAQLSIMVK